MRKTLIMLESHAILSKINSKKQDPKTGSFFYFFSSAKMPSRLKKLGLTLTKTLIQQLELVQTAIEAVLTSQSYEIKGKKLTRADLEMLQAREERLEEKIRKYGPNYTISQDTTPPRRGPVMKKAVWR